MRPEVLAVAVATVLIAAAPAAVTRAEDLSEFTKRPWAASLQRVNEALAVKDVSAAEQAWHEAYRTALGTRQRWDGMIEVGEAYLRVGDVAQGSHVARATARRLYLAALIRARQQGSVDGVLRAAQAFSALGDREVVTQCLRVADQVAEQARDPRARARVEAFRTRWRES
jgi:hypothetical protein